MAHPFAKAVAASENRRAKELSGGIRTRDVSAAELISGKAPRAQRPEKHQIAVPGGTVDLKRSYARGGAVKDISITLRRDHDGAEQKYKFRDGGFVVDQPKASRAKGMTDPTASRAKLHGPKIV